MAQLVRGDRVLVLGGSGFIGGHLIECLVDQGVMVSSFDIFPPSRPLPDGVAVTMGDVRDRAALESAAQGATAIKATALGMLIELALALLAVAVWLVAVIAGVGS